MLSSVYSEFMFLLKCLSGLLHVYEMLPYLVRCKFLAAMIMQMAAVCMQHCVRPFGRTLTSSVRKTAIFVIFSTLVTEAEGSTQSPKSVSGHSLDQFPSNTLP
jgi:hypothetical protein